MKITIDGFKRNDKEEIIEFDISGKHYNIYNFSYCQVEPTQHTIRKGIIICDPITMCCRLDKVDEIVDEFNIGGESLDSILAMVESNFKYDMW